MHSQQLFTDSTYIQIHAMTRSIVKKTKKNIYLNTIFKRLKTQDNTLKRYAFIYINATKDVRTCNQFTPRFQQKRKKNAR